MKKAIFISMIILSFTIKADAYRGLAPDVKPVVYKGIKYTAPHNEIGVVEAYDVETKKKLWEKKIYDIQYDFDMELDVQWIFIKELEIKDGSLLVVDEKNRQYILNIENIFKGFYIVDLSKGESKDDVVKKFGEPDWEGSGVNFIKYYDKERGEILILFFDDQNMLQDFKIERSNEFPENPAKELSKEKIKHGDCYVYYSGDENGGIYYLKFDKSGMRFDEFMRFIDRQNKFGGHNT